MVNSTKMMIEKMLEIIKQEHKCHLVQPVHKAHKEFKVQLVLMEHKVLQVSLILNYVQQRQTWRMDMY
jgi:hypothetical protein